MPIIVTSFIFFTGLHVWNLWTPEVSSIRRSGYRSMLQWRIYDWSPFWNFHIKMCQTPHHDYCQFDWVPICSWSTSDIWRNFSHCRLYRNMWVVLLDFNLIHDFFLSLIGLLGFFISWQFGACYSWIAQKGDITGHLAPLFLVSSTTTCILKST